MFNLRQISTLIVLSLSLLIGHNVYAQVNPYSGEEYVEEEIYTVVENEPEFPGGMEALYQYLSRNLRYPKEAKEKSISGKVYITFVIEKDGSISSPRILREIGGGCGAEALRVVKAMPLWKPGMHRGKPVRVQFNLPIIFTLTADDSDDSYRGEVARRAAETRFPVQIDDHLTLRNVEIYDSVIAYFWQFDFEVEPESDDARAFAASQRQSMLNGMLQSEDRQRIIDEQLYIIYFYADKRGKIFAEIEIAYDELKEE